MNNLTSVMTVDPLTPPAIRITAAIGIELTGLDLCRPPDPDVVAVIQDAVDRHHVVVIRDQCLDARQLRALAESFGPIVVSPVQRLTGSNRVVSTIEDTTERPPAGFGWHTDLSWTERPPALGFLNAVTIPPYGGDTLWTSNASIYDSLSVADRIVCDSATMLHAPDPSLLASIERHHGRPLADRLRGENAPVAHPLVRVHPTTGRRSLFLSPLYADRIVGPAGIDGRLIERLHALLEDPHVQIRWRWRPGDLVVWDETSTCHRALTDHHTQHRVMRRCVTASAASEAGNVRRA